MDPARIATAIVDLAAERGANKTICPSEVARYLGGQDEADWRSLMTPVREQAVRLALNGVVVITQVGDQVDPEDFSGIYRIAIAAEAN